jgi:hydrogenase expression/formation protein HypD
MMIKDKALIKSMLEKIQQTSAKGINIMEVCGTHTQAISRIGIRELVEPKINLLSGPGCPVCVTTEGYIDAAIELAKHPNMIIATFGDMMKVKGSKENLIEQREKGKDIRIVYSPLDAVNLAEKNKGKEISFLGVGFETTTPLIALAIKTSKKKGVMNFSILTAMKRMEPILQHILSDPNNNIHGLICPGHVAAVKGEEYFKFITNKYNIPAAIAGFEAVDIVGALYFLTTQQEEPQKSFKNLYKSCVTPDGNKKAQELIEEIFTYCSAQWRGIGSIEDSGLAFKEEYKYYDAAEKFGIKIEENTAKICECSEILLGKKRPVTCGYFGRECTPEKPIGPCMVSSEGSCSIFYKYTRSLKS